MGLIVETNSKWDDLPPGAKVVGRRRGPGVPAPGAGYGLQELAKNRLPGEDLVVEGRRDLAEGRETIAALLVSIGAPKLARLGEPVDRPATHPELRLYDLLARENSDSAHTRYNALVRRLVSYERARACVS